MSDNETVQKFGELLDALEPNIETKATKESGLTVSLHFDSAKVDTATMRKLATLAADHAV